MKVMILAGGFGSRISEESSIRPKPMVEIGSMPILWHIMKIYSAHGLNDFIICCGYKGDVIKDWFERYRRRFADITIDYRRDELEVHTNGIEPWRVTLAETGLNTMTGGRIKQAAKYADGETFCLTYGDGVGNIDISSTIDFHRQHGKLVTMTAVKPESRFGVFSLDEDSGSVSGFEEKPQTSKAWINGGYFVVEPQAVEYIAENSTSWELEPLQKISAAGELAARPHEGFWMPMDTLRDKNVLEELWSKNEAPWKCW